jgi:lipopolysaccharide/colanic/teichoic acid biosynthesis glycosyltransferase
MTRLRPAALIAMVLMVLTAPVLLLVALAVFLDLGRPVTFRQKRGGRNSIPFELIKFRTMRTLVDQAGKPLPDEMRITPVGRFLRRSRLDELPELLNIVRGDMGFIGPRPLLPDTIEGLGVKGIARGLVRPGLTGWSQVNGNTLLDLDEKLQLDIWYVNHRSWSLDMAIIWRTLFVMVGGERRNIRSLEHASNPRRGG